MTQMFLRSVLNDTDVFLFRGELQFDCLAVDALRLSTLRTKPYLAGCRVKHGMTGGVIPTCSVIPAKAGIQ